MSVLDDAGKYTVVCELVEETYPILAPVWRAARDRFGDRWLAEFITNLETLYGPVNAGLGGRLADALDGYAEFANDSLRNRAFYEKHGHYKASSYAECLDAYYHNADHMTRCYLPGMYLSHLLWPQHYNMLCGFRDNVLRRVGEPSVFFEVGVGCGMYSKTLLERLPRVRGVGFDIRHGYHEHCDFLVCQEVLEHLEKPEEFCGWLYDLTRPGGTAYITAALNAAHSDHIFHFHDPMELEAMVRAVGFQPLSLQEEFATGSKPRRLTPSLAGYFVERPR
jgi:hypothetical protein